jgi:GAF domain-containing protein
MTTRKVTIFGVLFGFVFIIIALSISLMHEHAAISFKLLATIHANFPALFIIDSAPIILGGVAYFFMRYLNKQTLEIQTQEAAENEKIRTIYTQFSNDIAAGNFNTTIELDDDLANVLKNLRDTLVKNENENAIRGWANEGLAKFADILRGNNEKFEILADTIISSLVKYLNANQGGLYVINDTNSSDIYLELIACYAWNKKKYIHQRIDEGEGLVGQAWQENDTLYITDIPKDYIRITSGLGDANPTSLLIIPLAINDEIFGVIELASFNLFEQYHIDFVNKLAESIASTLSTAKTNERTRYLLEQSQQQAEVMRAQEEEMRQNMEEMSATQEEMQRKEVQMHEMIEKMQQQEEEMRQNMEEMQATQEEMEKQQAIILKQKEQDAITKKLYENEINVMYEKWYAQLKRMEQFVKAK